MKEAEIKKNVRQGYARIAKEASTCCSPASSCCGGASMAETISKLSGYTDEEMESVPEGSNLGLGCGNPVALASLSEGETVIDLGSGAGFDCFLAAAKVGKKGRVIGVDMTPEMIEKARENAQKGNYENVEFRLGEIDNLPSADNLADAVISNCVINLTPDKKKVFMEAFRVLKPGGRLMISDIVLLKELPDVITNSVAAYIGCISGAIIKDRYLEAIKDAGFSDVRIIDEAYVPEEVMTNDPISLEVAGKLGLTDEDIKDIRNSILSVKVQAIKPG